MASTSQHAGVDLGDLAQLPDNSGLSVGSPQITIFGGSLNVVRTFPKKPEIFHPCVAVLGESVVAFEIARAFVEKFGAY
jgi:hypothetical protein